jgi:chemotaxis protein MotD
VVQAVPVPAVVPVPVAVPAIGETTAAPAAAEAETLSAATPVAADAKPVAIPAVEAAKSETAGKSDTAAVKTTGATPAGETAAAEFDVPATAETEATPETKAAPSTAAKPAADTDAAVKTANRSDAPAAQRDVDALDVAPKPTSTQAAPEAAGNSVTQPQVQTHTTTHQVAQPSAQQPTPSNTVPVPGLAVEIAAQAKHGNSHFEIRLDPPELGRIDVRLQIDGDGKVTSHLRVERPETLDMLRRDAPALERALQQAGLKTSDSGLQFSLRDQAFSQQNQERDLPVLGRIVVPDESLVPVETQRHYGRLAGLGSGVDIRV